MEVLFLDCMCKLCYIHSLLTVEAWESCLLTVSSTSLSFWLWKTGRFVHLQFLPSVSPRFVLLTKFIMSRLITFTFYFAVKILDVLVVILYLKELYSLSFFFPSFFIPVFYVSIHLLFDWIPLTCFFKSSTYRQCIPSISLPLEICVFVFVVEGKLV